MTTTNLPRGRCGGKPQLADAGSSLRYNNLPSYIIEAQAELDALIALVTDTRRFFDKLQFPVDERPSDKLLRLLHADADKAFWLPDLLREHASAAERDDCHEHLLRYRGCPWWLPVHQKVIVVAPHEDTIGRLAKQPWKPNIVELALDRIFEADRDALRMQDFRDRHGVQLWHGKRRMSSFETVSYMSEERTPGINLAAYADHHCKLTGECSCCHNDARIIGKRAVESLGIYSNADLPKFDDARHAAFWRRYERYAVVDRERLTRHYEYLHTKHRRRKSHIERFGGLNYNFDLRGGGELWRRFAAHPSLPLYAVQSFIDEYPGKGDTFIVPLTLYT